MVLVEAMACGLPVVSFDCPWGPRSIISNGEDGLLVENGNVSQLADAMLSLMHDDEQRQKMSARARVNVGRFALEKLALQWQQLFNSLS
jgi:glycosyltransferase involved in cell wall biosynthesis